MDIEDPQLVLQRMTDGADALRASLQRTFSSVTPAAHDDTLSLQPGCIVLDGVTGQPVEVISGQRTHHDV